MCVYTTNNHYRKSFIMKPETSDKPETSARSDLLRGLLKVICLNIVRGFHGVASVQSVR